jgi:alcohol dehydrogenase (NADP+)
VIKSAGYASKGRHSKLQHFEFERDEPGPNDVHIEILYCGVCHSDLHQVRNEWHNTVYPCLPGHEIVGRVARVGSAVTKFAVGDLAGVGCMIDSCGSCRGCADGLEQYCEGPTGFRATYNGPFKPDGTNTYGGYSDSIVVRESFVLRIPESLELSGVAPLLCAGVTTYSPMKRWQVGPGQTVGVVGLGGLGHVAVKLAKALGARVIVFTRSDEKADDARRLGASEVVLSTDEAAMKKHELSLDFAISTIPDPYDINLYVKLLKRDAAIAVVGVLAPYKAATDNMEVAAHRRTVAGSLIGGIAETQEVLDFCAEHGITADVELIPIDDINDAFDRMQKGEVRFRYVIDMASLAGPKA